MNELTEEINTLTQSTSGFRFTLRTMFVVMAMVAAAMALFIHYGPLPGLIFAAFVVLGSWCYLRGKKIGVVSFLVLYVALWVGLQFFGPYTSLRNRIVWVVGTERLREWADETLDNPPPADLFGTITIYPDAVPDDIRGVLGNGYNLVLLSDEGAPDLIMCAYGTNFHSWLIFLTRPQITLDTPDVFDKIADGIWAVRSPSLDSMPRP